VVWEGTAGVNPGRPYPDLPAEMKASARRGG
jgi:hypothetical protein